MKDRASSRRLRMLAAGIFWLLLLAAVPLALAASPPRPDAASAQVQALQRAGDAVVALRVTVTEGATSADSLGARRSGSGVVIGPDGLILTIGYLLLDCRSRSIEEICFDRTVGR